MLRITKAGNEEAVVLRLEGRLRGPWVDVLAQCWRSALAGSRGRRICVDLTGVTFVDTPGKARLADMHAHGAELIGKDLETTAIIAEIVDQPRG